MIEGEWERVKEKTSVMVEWRETRRQECVFVCVSKRCRNRILSHTHTFNCNATVLIHT